MTDIDKRMQKSPFKRFLLIFGVIMVAFYFGLGLLIIFWDDIPITLSKSYRVLFGSLLIIYAFFRLIRLIQTRKD